MATEPRKPTEKEAFFFLTILNSMKNKPEVDWHLVASRAGYSNGNSAMTRFNQIKKQIAYKEGGALPNPSPVKSRAVKKEKGVGSGTNINASKVTKRSSAKGGRKKSIVMKADPDADDIKEEFHDSGIAGLDQENEEIGDEYHNNAFEDAVEYYDTKEKYN